MKPSFTDAARWPVPYVPAAKTNIARTFARVRRQMAEQAEREEEGMRNVRDIGKGRRKAE